MQIPIDLVGLSCSLYNQTNSAANGSKRDRHLDSRRWVMKVHIGHTKEGDVISFQYTDSVYCANKTIRKKICYMIVQGVLQEDPKWRSGEYELRLMISSPEEAEGYIAVIQVPDGQMVERKPK
jgi:hypothetical protein